MRQPAYKLLVIGAPGVDISDFGLDVARVVRRPYFSPSVCNAPDDAIGAERDWFDSIASTSGPAVVAAGWSIARHVLDVRTSDHWIVFADSQSTDPDADAEMDRFREEADLVLEVGRRPDHALAEEIGQAWNAWLIRHAGRINGAGDDVTLQAGTDG